MDYSGVWGVDIKRIREFFDNVADTVSDTVLNTADVINGVNCTDDINEMNDVKKAFSWSFGDVAVCVEEQEPSYILKAPVPRTRVCITGPEQEAAVIHRAFMMNFMSAGG